jgi:UDP-GlcNAc3NAcA epimerase
MRIVTVLGTRPDFIKAAPVSRQLEHIPGVEEIIVHTGQHYDVALSDRILDEVHLPRPRVFLGAGSGPQGQQTGRMLEAVESALRDLKPDKLVVHGDTNSTLAGALAAVKLHIPVAHVEAGVRSFDRAMAEEVNRMLVDHLASWLYVTHPAAAELLRREGIADARITCVGDVTLDAVRLFAPCARENRLRTFAVAPGQYVLATFHRAENTDDPACLRNIVAALEDVATRMPVLAPLHPRTRLALKRAGLAAPSAALHYLPPQGYLDMLALERFARLIVTDSGTVQREAYFHRVPSVILRPDTEWRELITLGWARLLPPRDGDALRDGIHAALDAPRPTDDGALLGDGRAAWRLARHLADTATSALPLAG